MVSQLLQDIDDDDDKGDDDDDDDDHDDHNDDDDDHNDDDDDHNDDHDAHNDDHHHHSHEYGNHHIVYDIPQSLVARLWSSIKWLDVIFGRKYGGPPQLFYFLGRYKVHKFQIEQQ